MGEPLTVVFFPEGAYGPTNNCAGIGDVLRRRGARVIFVVEESFAGTLEAKGFEERTMRLKPKPELPEEPGQFWKDFIRDTAPEFRRSTTDQLESLILPIWKELIDGSRYADDRLEEIFAEVEPDVIVEDNVVCFPAVVRSGRPWVRIVSCNPLEIKDSGIPPTFSGLGMNDRGRWGAFRNRYLELHSAVHADFDRFVKERGCPPLMPGEFIHASPHLNVYIYPAEIDYPRSNALSDRWLRLDSSVRSTDQSYELPERLKERKQLLYLSLGSLGSADTVLMQRLIDLLAETTYGVIVSMGPQHELLRLAKNMAGGEYLPQTAILPLVDLVITHGGNNTVTESLHFGKPMVVIPLFWDQHDNAQRIDETGLGVRFPYAFDEKHLLAAIQRLLGDSHLEQRLTAMSSRVRAERGTARVADAIEQLVRRSVRSG